MNSKRYRPQILRPTENLNLENTFVEIESKSWKRSRMLSLEILGGILNIKTKDFSDRNITALKYVNQEENPHLPPKTFKVDIKTHIAVDENYLYVWIHSLKRWKRILLSDW